MLDFDRNIAAVRVVDNEVHFYYRLDGLSLDDGPNVTLGDLAAEADADARRLEAVIPADQAEALGGRYRDTPIWEADVGTRSEISTDLHPAAKALLSGQRPDLLRRWHLTQQARRFVESAALYNEATPKDDRVRKRLQLEFSAVACDRINTMGLTCSPLWVRFVDLQFLALSTGAAYLVGAISLSRLDGKVLSAYDLIEGVNALARFNKCRWVREETEQARGNGESKEEPEKQEGETIVFSLGHLMQRLVRRDVASAVVSNRVNSYAYLRLAETQPRETLKVLSAFLARRYSSDYALDVTEARITNVCEFRNVHHAITGEGAATVICPNADGELSDFMRNWKENSFRATYSLIVLLKFHENWFLTRGRIVSFGAVTGDQTDIIEILDNILHASLVFRLSFRFPTISSITMHNEVSEAMRTHLQLDRKLDEMQGDVEAIVERLGSARKEEQLQAEERRRHNTYWIGNLAGAALMGFAAFSVLTDLLPALILEVNAHRTLQDRLILVAMVIGAAVSSASWRFGMTRRSTVPTSRGGIRRKLDAIRLLMIRK